MKKGFCLAILFASVLMFNQGVSAHQLETDMRVLAKSMTAFAQTQDLAEAKKQLMLMRKAAVASKASSPHKLEGVSKDDEQLKAYQHGLDLLLAQIDSVNALVEKGQLEQAKVQALELVKLRNEYHQQFK